MHRITYIFIGNRLKILMYTMYIHISTDILSSVCLQEHAFESSQKYKEGKYIIEMAHMIKENGWESPPNK